MTRLDVSLGSWLRRVRGWQASARAAKRLLAQPSRERSFVELTCGQLQHRLRRIGVIEPKFDVVQRDKQPDQDPGRA